MNYFKNFPTIYTTDYSGNKVKVTNIMERVEIVPSLLKNPLLFYRYDIQSSDTPDTIASKYYNDSYRYWLVMFGNQIFDSQSDWPMNPNLFNDYLVDKYASATANSLNISVANVTSSQILTYTQNTIYNYVESVTTIDSTSSESNTTTYIIDSNAYANVHQGTVSVLLPSGAGVTVTTQAYPQYIYDYEVQTNEAKRNINIINTDYVGTIEKQLKTLL
jgi:hypothetical protein